ncbi:MAG: hypothetical protein Q7V57_05135 [Actinomycetota bacterium]|nr:hypothetical protein [Actinomycetota bacterium]
MNEFDFHLGRLLDDAAAEYRPVPDVQRLQRQLATHRRRGAAIVLGVAAGLALVGGTALAYSVQQADAPRLQPADHSPTVTSAKPSKPPFGTDTTTPSSEPVKDTSPTETAAPSSEVAVQPPATAPKATAPKTTQPKTTEPKPTEPTVSVPDTVAWSVFQMYGSCDSTPPFDVFYGTATPGVRITVESAWGFADGTADEHGNWEIRIEFPDSPVGEPFRVGVRYEGVLTKFWFTRLPAV